MAYYVSYNRTRRVVGPFRTIAEARRETIAGRFEDGADVYDGDVRNPTAMVGQGRREYDGQRWIMKYWDSKTGKYHYLNKDGTLSDTMDPRKGLTAKPNYKIWMDYDIIHDSRLPIPLGWVLINARSLNDLRAEIIRTVGATKRFGNVTARIEKPNGEYVGILYLNLSEAIDRNETYTWSNPARPPGFKPDHRSVDPATGKIYGINHESDKYRRKDLKPGHAYVDTKACRSTNYYAGPTERALGFKGKDDRIYIGRSWRYDSKGHYDNTENTLTYLSDNDDILDIISARTGNLDGYPAKTIAEFKRLRKGPLAKYRETVTYTLGGKPLDAPKKAPAKRKTAAKRTAGTKRATARSTVQTTRRRLRSAPKPLTSPSDPGTPFSTRQPSKTPVFVYMT